jgi:hypothetical protein
VEKKAMGILVLDSKEKHAIVGHDTIVFSKYKVGETLPMIHCDYGNLPDTLPPHTIVDIQIDDNPWISTYTYVYTVIFRVIGVIGILLGIVAFNKVSSTPEVLKNVVIIEGVILLIDGIILIGGGMYTNKNWNIILHILSFTQFEGLEMITTTICGMYYYKIYWMNKKMIQIRDFEFFTTKRLAIIGIVTGISIGVDIYSVESMYFENKIPLTSDLFLFCFNVFIGFYFIVKTQSLLNTSIDSLQKQIRKSLRNSHIEMELSKSELNGDELRTMTPKTKRRYVQRRQSRVTLTQQYRVRVQEKHMKFLTYWVIAHSVSLIIFRRVSGVYITGIFDPQVWFIVWIISCVNRQLISFSKVMMCASKVNKVVFPGPGN